MRFSNTDLILLRRAVAFAHGDTMGLHGCSPYAHLLAQIETEMKLRPNRAKRAEVTQKSQRTLDKPW